MSFRKQVPVLSFLFLFAAAASGQRTLEIDRSLVSQVRIDLRDLGYPPVDVIPSDESAIRALAVAPNGSIYGATSGRRSHLFVLEPLHGYVRPLGFLKDVTTVHRSLVVSRQGDVYIGGSLAVDNNGEGYKGYAGGHLYRYTPKEGRSHALRVDAACEVADLGIPVAGEGIYTLAMDRLENVIYGLTYPNGQFFSYNVDLKKFATHGAVAQRRMPGEKFEDEKNIGRVIALDQKGHPYTSGENAAVYRFDRTAGRLERTSLVVPAVRGREPYNRWDAWTLAPSGLIYGGTSDGYLFRFDPESMEIANLGKPLNQYRIRGLVLSGDGKLYGVGGDDDEMARLFSYQPGSGVYEMLGMIDVNRRPYYTWHAYVIDAMAIGRDGTIYMGQSERKSKLYLFYPEMATQLPAR